MRSVSAVDNRPLSDLSPAELNDFLAAKRAAYQALQGRGLKLDLTRGKPSAAQLDLADGLLKLPTSISDADGVDVRNYGGLTGIRQIREIFAELLWVEPEQVIAGGNSSLTMMHDCLVQMLLHGPVDGQPWVGQPIKFVCPVPGYDRHFTMLASYGIEMLPVPMEADGPDVAAIEALVKDDPMVKGMWIVPTYANPVGSTISHEKAALLAAMPTAAADFKIFWDNAYAFHHLTEEEAKSEDIISLCSAAGNPNRPIMFASTSKITYAGAGVAVLAASSANVGWYQKHYQYASIGPDKVNQLRHVQFFTNAQGVRDHMVKHREILAPKFAAVDAALTAELAGLGVAEWTKPTGGYFVNLDVVDGTAGRVVQLAKEAGIVLTPAGASFPHGHDPRDRNIRLAPSFPVLEEVETAMAGVATCVALAAAEELSGRHTASASTPEGH
ncbi:PLP-dependent aminotransferase family protein [Nostocoides australiense]|uniref:aminotransferase n=1 Tax=Nostocoides australiense TaxID=99480 RepID=UPI000661247E|nr:aminotransferase [Tetrasphaera australiensis]MCA0290538.1 aminotransferase [Actinomycetota bacterium]MCB1302012.1 aminotransferase [Tetrasphaera sp.]HPF81176.1 aminotransferase [Tetrasphaera australiensis]HRW02293.1 aminotransferase [Tetrasphaera sp.]